MTFRKQAHKLETGLYSGEQFRERSMAEVPHVGRVVFGPLA